MAVAVTGAAKAPAEATEQEDHEYDDENEPKRHERLPFAGANLNDLATKDRSRCSRFVCRCACEVFAKPSLFHCHSICEGEGP